MNFFFFAPIDRMMKPLVVIASLHQHRFTKTTTVVIKNNNSHSSSTHLPTMAEEGKKPAAAAAAAAPANGDAAKENNNKKNQRNKREDKPIEELYDLSKPIPKVRRQESRRMTIQLFYIAHNAMLSY
jgi:hypothetical protein